ncbi:MAG: acyl-CoA thioester hydrolase/BAAT C-terminal domain-containing protein [Bacteroidota bacterium]
MEKLKGSESNRVNTLAYATEGLSDSSAVAKASIQVENIQGPILLFSGSNDEVWPAAMMSDMIEKRITRSGFGFSFENIQYEHAGHLISANPDFPPTTRQGKLMIDGKSYDYNFGGTVDGDMAAQKDATMRVFDFLSKLRNE